MKRQHGFTVLLGVAVVMVFVGGCGSDKTNNSLTNFQPEIVNAADNFQFQATALTGVSTAVTYSWDNSGTQATIDHSSSVTSGTTLLELLDANSTVVYSDSLKASGSEPSAAGVAGTWTVRVTLTGVQGTLNFRAQKL